MSENLRQWCMTRWKRRHATEIEHFMAACWTLHHWRWIDRFNDWHVARFGETNRGPWWVRPIAAFVVRADDWRLACAMRFGGIADFERTPPASPEVEAEPK